MIEETIAVRRFIADRTANPEQRQDVLDGDYDGTEWFGHVRAALGTNAYAGGEGDKLLSAAKDFYNGTIADPAVRISCSTKERRDRVKAMGERLRDELKAAQANSHGVGVSE